MLKKAVNCLNPNLIKIYKKTAEIEQLSAKIIKHLPSQLQSKIHIASFDKGQLVLKAIDPAIRTELRYLLPELRENLRSKEQLYSLVNIRIC